MEEANELIDLANQMGLIKGLYEQSLQNQTKCNKWYDIQESHIDKEGEQVLELHDFHGLFLLLSVGLSAAALTFFTEILMHYTQIDQRFVSDIP